MIIQPTTFGKVKSICPYIQIIEIYPETDTVQEYYDNSYLHILTGEMTIHYWMTNPDDENELIIYKSGIVSANDTIHLSVETVSFEASLVGCGFIFSSTEDHYPES